MESSLGEVLLHIRDVSLRLSGMPILDGVSFEVRDRLRPGITTGQIVGILGPSGVGKTRLLRIIAGLDAPDSGTVTGHYGVKCTAGEVGVVFQNYPLLRHRTVRANLEVVGSMGGLSPAAARTRATKLLEGFRLADRAHLYPAQLSGGQRQRLAIAQQMVCDKTLLLLDEPFSGLDPVTLEDVMHLIAEVANMSEVNTILLVTHDIRAAMAVSDTLLMLGRSRAADGQPIMGARIQASYDLVEQGLTWHSDIMDLPAFATLEKELRARFKQL
jgi:polar amino acid transport system ATP-binding protein/sulfate transport system ATP-binding protein